MPALPCRGAYISDLPGDSNTNLSLSPPRTTWAAGSGAPERSRSKVGPQLGPTIPELPGSTSSRSAASIRGKCSMGCLPTWWREYCSILMREAVIINTQTGKHLGSFPIPVTFTSARLRPNAYELPLPLPVLITTIVRVLIALLYLYMGTCTGH